jgi:FAD:protein FMN transferase
MGSMNRRQFVAMAAGTTGAAGLAALGLWNWLGRGDKGKVPAEVVDGLRSADLKSVCRQSWALGSDVSITTLHAKPEVAQQAIDAALAELERMEQAMSLFRQDSQINRLNQDGSLSDPDPHLVLALESAAAMSLRSGGAFDATIQPLWTVYEDAHLQNRLPDERTVEAAWRRVGWDRVGVQRDSIRLTRPGTAVTLNGIAQGLAADRVLAVLRDHGIEHALVNTGETAAMGRRADGGNWTTGIQHPRHPNAFVAVAAFDGRALSTSGDYATTFSPDYVFNHIFDPATGRSPTAFSSVTVVSPACLDADALSTAIFVLGAEKGLQLATSIPNTDVLLVFKDGRTLTTKGFPRAEARVAAGPTICQ